MSRVFLLALCLVVPTAFLAGCTDNAGNVASKPPEAAQQEAVKMPPPPGMKPSGKK